jgi:hypothetical protein
MTSSDGDYHLAAKMAGHMPEEPRRPGESGEDEDQTMVRI